MKNRWFSGEIRESAGARPQSGGRAAVLRDAQDRGDDGAPGGAAARQAAHEPAPLHPAVRAGGKIVKIQSKDYEKSMVFVRKS